jgi:uncharacterized protein (TIRG00374 family)
MANVKTKKSKYTSYLLRFLIAAAALYLAAREVDLRQVTKILLGIRLWIFALGLGTYIVGQLIFVMRWCMLMRVQSVDIGYWPAVRLHLLGLFYNNCLPGSVGGDVLRAWYVTKHTERKLEAALSVFVDRIVGLVGIVFMAFFSYWFLPSGDNGPQFETKFIGSDFLTRLIAYKWLVVWIAAAVAIAAVVFMRTKKGRGFSHRAFGLIREHGLEGLRKTRMAIHIYYRRKLALGYALLLTFACQGICIIGMWLIGKDMGVTAGIKYYFIFFPISWLLGTLPISVGGVGVMELWLKMMFVRVCAVPENLAFALASSQRILWIVGSLPGVVIHLIGAHLPKDFFVDHNKSID